MVKKKYKKGFLERYLLWILRVASRIFYVIKCHEQKSSFQSTVNQHVVTDPLLVLPTTEM